MAKKAGEETTQTDIGSFQKNVNSSVLVSLVDWHGENFVDVREVLPAADGWTYTAKGVRFRSDLVPELVALLQKVSPGV